MVRTSEWRKGKELELEPAPCAETFFRTMFAVRMNCGAGEELLQVQKLLPVGAGRPEDPSGRVASRT